MAALEITEDKKNLIATKFNTVHMIRDIKLSPSITVTLHGYRSPDPQNVSNIYNDYSLIRKFNKVGQQQDMIYDAKRRKMRLLQSNVKCRYLKQLTCKGTVRQVFYLSEAPPPTVRPHTPHPLTHCIRVYSILIHTGRGGGGGGGGRANQREDTGQ